MRRLVPSIEYRVVISIMERLTMRASIGSGCNMTGVFLIGICAGAFAAFIGGALIARKFRAPALLLASAAIVATAAGIALGFDWPLLSTILSATGFVSLMQGGYLVGSSYLRG